MLDFEYIAIGKDGHRSSGIIKATNLASASHLLKEQGLLPTKLDQKGAGLEALLDKLKTVGTISLNEKIGFIQNLGIMLKAGISMSRCLSILVKQTKNSKFHIVLADIAAMVESGHGLGEALEKYENIFSGLFISMVKVGEMSGNLDKSLEYLAVQLQREADLKSKVKGAMIYPSVIVSSMVIVGVLMSIYVLPNLTSTFKEFDSGLPPLTRMVVAFADFMSAHSFIVIGGLIGFIIAGVIAVRQPEVKRILDRAFLKLPVLSGILKKINLARFARILSSLLKSTIPIGEALNVSGQSLGNSAYREVVAKCAGDVRLGKTLYDSLSLNENLFPVLVSQMIQVGEESGSLENILEQLALHYEEEVDTVLKNLSSIIEPVLLLVIGGVVAILAVALIMPIYNISQNIN